MRGYFEKVFHEQEQDWLKQHTRDISLLLLAVEQKNLSKIRQLLRKGADVNVRALGGGKTPLHVAVETGEEKIVEVLMQAKADVHAATEKKHTPLHVAAQGNHAPLIKKLISASAQIDATTGAGCTPLHQAAAVGAFVAVKTLLELKADPTIRDSRFNLTAANFAQEYGHPEVRGILVQAMTYAQQFNQDIRFILFDCKRGDFQNPLVYQFLNHLEKEIKNTEDADILFSIVGMVLRSSAYISAKKALLPIVMQLMASMQHYRMEKMKTIVPFAANPRAQGLTIALRELGVLAQGKHRRYRPIDLILEYSDLPKP